jgi:hypothetical protein
LSHKHGLFHRIGSFVRRETKKETRVVARVTAKASPYVNAVASGVATYFGGPIAGEAVAGALAEGSYYAGSTAARAHGKHGRDARHAGVVLRKKSFKTSQYGIGAGGVASSLVAAGSSAGGFTFSNVTSALQPVLKTGLQLGLGALHKPQGMELGIQTNDGSLALSAGGLDESHYGARDSGMNTTGPMERPSGSGLGVVLLALGLALASRRKAA